MSSQRNTEEFLGFPYSLQEFRPLSYHAAIAARRENVREEVKNCLVESEVSYRIAQHLLALQSTICFDQKTITVVLPDGLQMLVHDDVSLRRAVVQLLVHVLNDYWDGVKLFGFPNNIQSFVAEEEKEELFFAARKGVELARSLGDVGKVEYFSCHLARLAEFFGRL